VSQGFIKNLEHAVYLLLPLLEALQMKALMAVELLVTLELILGGGH